jgi:hypothetical protein
VQPEQGQPFQQPQGWLPGRVRQLPPRGRRGQRRRRITQLEAGLSQPRPGLRRRLDVTGDIGDAHRLLEQRRRPARLA